MRPVDDADNMHRLVGALRSLTSWGFEDCVESCSKSSGKQLAPRHPETSTHLDEFILTFILISDSLSNTKPATR